MALKRHADFIRLMTERTAAGTWENFRKRHANDPQIPSLGDETHNQVCDLGECVDLSSPEATRASLIKKFKAEAPDGKLNRTVSRYRPSIRNYLLKKVMKASGLRYFELDGKLYIHWSEKV